jgi:hypothetical protein
LKGKPCVVPNARIAKKYDFKMNVLTWPGIKLVTLGAYA